MMSRGAERLLERKQRNKTKTEQNEIQGNKKMILKRERETGRERRVSRVRERISWT